MSFEQLIVVVRINRQTQKVSDWKKKKRERKKKVAPEILKSRKKVGV
jgi:hypothetical protein